MSALAITAIGALAGTAINAYQRHQEKKRQERIDAYNQRINRRDYLTQKLMASPSYQKKQLSEAGYNPYASGDLPSIQPPSSGSTLAPQPMETSSVGSALSQGVQSAVSASLQSASIANQRQALEIQAQELQVKQGELALAQNQTEFQQNKAMLDKLLELYQNDMMPKSSIDKVASKYGFEVVGQGREARYKEKLIQASEAQIKQAEAQTRLIDVEKEMKEFEKEWQEPNMRQLYVQRALEIDALRANIGSISLNTERAQIAKSVEEIQAEIYKVYGSLDDVALDQRIKLIQDVKMLWMKSDYFKDKYMMVAPQEYRKFLEWMRLNDKDLAQQNYWKGWIESVANVVQSGAMGAGAFKMMKGFGVQSPTPRVWTPSNYSATPSTMPIPYRQ